MVRTHKSKFGKTMRCFQTNWYANRGWLEYSAQRNACYRLLLMAEIKHLLTQDVRTGKQVWRQVRDWISIPLVNRTFKLYPCGWSVKQEKKAVLQLASCCHEIWLAAIDIIFQRGLWSRGRSPSNFGWLVTGPNNFKLFGSILNNFELFGGAGVGAWPLSSCSTDIVFGASQLYK